MNAPVRTTAPDERLALELLTVTVDLVVRALTGVTGSGGIISQTRDL